MRAAREKRKPAAGEALGSLKTGKAGAVSILEDISQHVELQAFRVRRRFPALSWPVARRVAELAFGRAA